MRAFVVADADALSDAAFGNEPNIMLFIDAIRWLGGEESFTGAIATTEDVRIEHTKQKDLVWFYGTIFVVPSLVLGLGSCSSARESSPRSGGPRPAKPKGVRDELSSYDCLSFGCSLGLGGLAATMAWSRKRAPTRPIPTTHRVERPPGGHRTASSTRRRARRSRSSRERKRRASAGSSAPS